MQSLLQSINAGDPDLRYRAIETAHKSTFDWIFTLPELGVWNWIQWGRGVFWINGKPGSGKSTAMKHIYRRFCAEHERALHDSSDVCFIVAKFFFSHRGSTIQKSFEGLLRSLLHQVLSIARETLESILPAWLQMDPKRSSKWSPFELDSIWEQILEQKQIKLDVTLFLDALDEFDGPSEKIVRFIEKTVDQPIGSMTQVRVCCASRPWDVFNDRFSRFPGFKIENYTKEDIKRYVWDTMNEHEAMRIWLQSPDPDEFSSARKLISSILSQADGVFIWVKLVLGNLLDARTSGAEPQELNEILKSLPSELEDLYRALLDRVKRQGYRAEAYAMLEILVRAPRPLTLHEFRCIVKCATIPNLDKCIEVLQTVKPQMSKIDVDGFRRRIRSRCGGLVEIVSTELHTTSAKSRKADQTLPKAVSKDEKDATIYTVQLMHQTVKEYVARPEFKGVLDLPNSLISTENGHSFLAKFGLVMIKGAISRAGGVGRNKIQWLSLDCEKNFELCAEAYAQAEITTGLSQGHLLESVSDRQFAHFFPQDRYDNDPDAAMDYKPRKWPIDTRLSFAVAMGLLIYLKSDTQISPPVPFQGMPILHCVMEMIHYDSRSKITMMTKILLRQHADVHEIFEGLDPFQALFRCCDPTLEPNQQTEAFGRIAELLLEHGSHPDTDVFYLSDNVDDFHNNPSIYTSKPLHVMIGSPAMISLLLDYGANVNGLDGIGRTPLDKIVALAASERENPGDLFDVKAGLESAKIIMQNGGRVTQQSLDEILI